MLAAFIATYFITERIVHPLRNMTNATKKFGKGDIVKINKNEKFIYVKFWGGEKKFIFPDAFKMGFLEIE